MNNNYAILLVQQHGVIILQFIQFLCNSFRKVIFFSLIMIHILINILFQFQSVQYKEISDLATTLYLLGGNIFLRCKSLIKLSQHSLTRLVIVYWANSFSIYLYITQHSNANGILLANQLWSECVSISQTSRLFIWFSPIP